MGISTGVKDLGRRHPEWEPWLAVIREILHEIDHPMWDSAVPVRADVQENKIPLLTRATLGLEASSVERAIRELFDVAYRTATAKMTTLKSASIANFDTLSLFKASLCQDLDCIAEFAAGLGADLEAFEAVAALIPMPFLHACNRRWAGSIAANWIEGYCPICGSWPAFAEVRGIERNRYLRCSRCGGEWQAHCLFCPYCATVDHNQLVSLVPEKNSANCAVEACNRCRGYIKTFTTLQPSPPAEVIIEDLASVDLDVAALEQGYNRPRGAGYALNVNVMENGVAESRLA